ncbi:AAA domain-containing protein [Balnearium lithotrophicum]|uniref:AAA domain-containing protein n=1 Tax=Balnearium lithotrophicum TaxID=223788 RepID=A0A521DZW8_9BACT|nr:AAA family ATPase [Balnearium lithotrophicum]SMO77244.1 AAA domain-containing protein [Balnearium lithotrophicum]
MKTHVQKAIEKTVQTLFQFYHERKEPLHGAVWGEWMSGKTKAALKIKKADPTVKYMKFPERRITDSQFVAQVALAIGLPPKRSFLETLDLIKDAINYKKLTFTIIIDESQRLFEKKRFLSILKDITEELEYPGGLIFIFLGDRNLTKFLYNDYHSLVKRIIVRKQVSPIDRDTVETLLKKHGYSTKGSETLTKLLKKEGITTGELDIALHLARKKSVEELNGETLRVFLEAAVGGVR